MNNRRKNLIVALLPIILIPLVLIIAHFYSKIRAFILPCPFYGFLGILCPGCGGTRAVYALLELDFFRALRCNAFYCEAALLCFMFWLENALSLSGKEIKIIPRSRAFIITASGITVAYLILRNFIPMIAPV